jgi:hypothetical protein
MIEYICEGCVKVSASFKCQVYPEPPTFFVRRCRCPFNPPKEKTKKKFQRVGQQKTKRFKSK